LLEFGIFNAGTVLFVCLNQMPKQFPSAPGTVILFIAETGRAVSEERIVHQLLCLVTWKKKGGGSIYELSTGIAD